VGWRCSSAESERASRDQPTAALISNANAKIEEASTVPLDDGGGLDQHNRVGTARPYSIEPNPEQPIAGKRLGSTWPLPAKYMQLMTERKDL
jgi:hypothetical protein